MKKEQLTEQLKELVSNDAFCVGMATHKEAFNATLYQIQLSLTTEENKDSIGPTVLALREIHEVFGDLILKGEALLEIERRKKPKQ